MTNNTHPVVRVVRLPHAKDLPLPSYETDHAAGMDVRAALDERVTIWPGNRALVPTGLKIELPLGYEAQIRPRSGLAIRDGITLVNSPGTIDADYRGEVKVIMINHGDQEFHINHGDRIAQMIIAPVTRVQMQAAEELNESERGECGFGSTGVK
ncbi:MAG TPA: dUTP diphosphatase [Balneolales bacterium]|nr:dUTP diphosphatase [Balneolales bacterium]